MLPKIQSFYLRLKERKPAFLAGAIIILLLILSLFIIKSQQSKPVPQPSQQGKTPSTPQGSPSPAEASAKAGPPQVSFSSYDNKATLPIVPQTVNGYTLKANYSVEEAKELGKRLGMTETKVPDDRFVILYNMNDMNNRGILTFDRVTGGLSFQSYGVHKTDSPNPEGPQDTARRFLTSLNLLDPTISCPITYQRKALTGVIFVECHRDWSLVGLPILNTIGVLNIPENKSLSSLAVGQTDQYSPDDPSITNVSTGNGNGKARPNDFNTITVGVTEDGRILSLESTMRKITESKQYTSSDLLTPEEALNQFITHKSQFSLTIPAGSGSVDWSKVYPDNKASGKKAVITDYLLTYLENPGQAPQDKLTPMYIIRGTVELSSGYTVRFIETIPALKSGLSFLPQQGQVAGASTTNLAQSESGLKLGTFEPDISPQPSTRYTPIPGQPSPTPQSPSTQFQCQPLRGATFTFTIPGLGELQVAYGGHTYYYKSASFPIHDIEDVRNVFNNLVIEQYLIFTARLYTGIKPKAVPDESLPPQLQNRENVLEWFRNRQGLSIVTRVGPQTPILHLAEEYPSYGEVANESLRRTNERMRYVAETVADRFLTLLANNQVNEWASKADIFPPFSNQVFYMTLIDSSRIPNFDTTCYISGYSPSLYFYPDKETEITVSIGGPTSYSYPSLSSNSWSVVAKPDGSLCHAELGSASPYEIPKQVRDDYSCSPSYSRLYYEYDKSKVSFTEPKEGFVVKREEWEGFIRDTLAPQLGLTERETADLVTDIDNALPDDSSFPPYSPYPYLKLSFASRTELDEKLAVSIYPQPTLFHRIHLLLTPLGKSVEVTSPSLGKLSRDGFTAVEVGATIKE